MLPPRHRPPRLRPARRCGSDDEAGAPPAAEEPPPASRPARSRSRSSTGSARPRSRRRRSASWSPVCASRTRCSRSASSPSPPPSGTASIPARSSRGPRRRSATRRSPRCSTSPTASSSSGSRALRPDLIVAVYSGLTQKDYDTLSKIAPTIAQPPGQVDWGSSWQDEILTVGRAVGRPEAGREAARRGRGAARRRGRGASRVQGQTAAVATPYQGIWVYGPQDARSRLLVELGFTFPDALADVGGDDVRRPALGREARPARRRRAGVVRQSRPGREGAREQGLPAAGRAHRGPRHLPARERRRCTRRRRSSACSAFRCWSTSWCPSWPPPQTAIRLPTTE